MTVHDITPALGTEAPDWPGDPAFQRTSVSVLDKGDSCSLSQLSMSAHAGAHLDAPAHFIPGGRTLDSYPLDSFILPALVVTVNHPEEVRPEELRKAEVCSGMALLIKTHNSDRAITTSREFCRDYVHLSREAALWCVEKKVALVGIDAMSVDRFGDKTHPVHHLLLGAGILVLEGLCLRDVDSARHTLICLPLKMPGTEASPVRAVLTDYRQE